MAKPSSSSKALPSINESPPKLKRLVARPAVAIVQDTMTSKEKMLKFRLEVHRKYRQQIVKKSGKEENFYPILKKNTPMFAEGGAKPQPTQSTMARRSGLSLKSAGKNYRHPWEGRKSLSEDYEGEQSGREGWWRTYIRETPIPGSYEMEPQALLYDLEKKQNTYRFKNDGRTVDVNRHGKGALLLPGAYNHTDFLQKFERDPATYGFKSEDRDKHDVLNFGKKDKDIDVSPNAYGVEKYMTLTVDKLPSKHGVFKSQARRFPTIQFVPKEGPAPGNYESNSKLAPRPYISSSFKSKTPRFASSHTRVPGPGSYDKTYQSPQNGVLQKMGRQHGLFFSSAFQV